MRGSLEEPGQIQEGGAEMATEKEELQRRAESVHSDIIAHLRGIHEKINPFWSTSPCHGALPCDYLDDLTQLQVVLQRTMASLS